MRERYFYQIFLFPGGIFSGNLCGKGRDEFFRHFLMRGVSTFPIERLSGEEVFVYFLGFSGRDIPLRSIVLGGKSSSPVFFSEEVQLSRGGVLDFEIFLSGADNIIILFWRVSSFLGGGDFGEKNCFDSNKRVIRVSIFWSGKFFSRYFSGDFHLFKDAEVLAIRYISSATLEKVS